MEPDSAGCTRRLDRRRRVAANEVDRTVGSENVEARRASTAVNYVDAKSAVVEDILARAQAAQSQA